MTTTTGKPAIRPARPYFSSGPCAKRPGWTPEKLKDAALGRSHRAKIETGVRTGGLTRVEATQLKNEFYGIARLETSYRRSGGRFTAQEQNDLMRRLNALSVRISHQRHDSQRRY